MVRRAKQLLQAHNLCAVLSGLGNTLDGPTGVVLRVGRAVHLYQTDFDRRYRVGCGHGGNYALAHAGPLEEGFREVGLGADDSPALHDERDVAQRGDLLQRVALNCYEVGQEAYLNRPEVVGQAEDGGIAGGRRPQRVITFVIIEVIVFNDRLVTRTKKFHIHYINWKPLNTLTLIRR